MIHPFSGSPRKNWPLEKFRALAARLERSMPVHWCAGRRGSAACRGPSGSTISTNWPAGWRERGFISATTRASRIWRRRSARRCWRYSVRPIRPSGRRAAERSGRAVFRPGATMKVDALAALLLFASGLYAADALVDRVGSTGFVQLQAESFKQLTPKQQALVYWLTQASIAIDPIIYDQNSAFGLRQKRLLEEIMRTRGLQKIADFTKLFWASRGNHNDTTAQKFLPEFTFDELKSAAHAALAKGRFKGRRTARPRSATRRTSTRNSKRCARRCSTRTSSR